MSEIPTWRRDYHTEDREMWEPWLHSVWKPLLHGCKGLYEVNKRASGLEDLDAHINTCLVCQARLISLGVKP